MEVVAVWEKIMYISAGIAFILPLIVLIVAGRWIVKTYFTKTEGRI